MISYDSEIPAHGQQVTTASALIHHKFNGKSKIFMPKRADTKKFLPGVYELPGGHIEFGEGIIEGLIREIKEELGMTIKVGDPVAAFTYINEVKGSHSIEVVYFATFIEPIDQIQLDPGDHSTCEWVDMTNISIMLENRPEGDPELAVVKRGLEWLAGGKVDTGV